MRCTGRPPSLTKACLIPLLEKEPLIQCSAVSVLSQCDHTSQCEKECKKQRVHANDQRCHPLLADHVAVLQKRLQSTEPHGRELEIEASQSELIQSRLVWLYGQPCRNHVLVGYSREQQGQVHRQPIRLPTHVCAEANAWKSNLMFLSAANSQARNTQNVLKRQNFIVHCLQGTGCQSEHCKKQAKVVEVKGRVSLQVDVDIKPTLLGNSSHPSPRILD